MDADWIGWVLGGIGSLIAGVSLARHHALGVILGVGILTVAWFGLFVL